MTELERCYAEQSECRDYILGANGNDVDGAERGMGDWIAEEAMIRGEYAEFIKQKSQLGDRHGFDPVWMPEFLFDFQKALVEWSIQKGRSAMFADCGLGKTPMQLVWAENVHRHTNKPVIIFTPLAVGPQTVREGAKFGVQCRRCSDGKLKRGDGIVITNYERIHYFDPADFSGAVCDESSAIKAFDGKRREQVTEFMRMLPYRLLCTATAAPNDYVELGTSSEALGEMGHMDMLARFFKNDQNTSDTSHRMHGQISQWRFKGHAEQHFWRWVCSWARAMRKPSDLGFDDSGFALPPLVTREHIVETRSLAEGMLFAVPASNMREEREERRRTIQERCEMAAELVQGHDYSVVWCHLNDEGDLLERLIPYSLQVSGSDTDEYKEAVAEWFSGARCVCKESWFGGKLKAWQSALRGIGSSIMATTEISGLLNPVNTGEPTPSAESPTTPSTTWKTKRRSPSKRRNIEIGLKQSESSREKLNTPLTPRSSSETPRSGRPPIQGSDLTKGCESMASPLTSTIPSLHTSKGRAPYAEGEIRVTRGAEDCTLTTATRAETSEDSSVQTATLGSANSEMTPTLSRGRSCICGHVSGHRRLISKSKIFGFGLNWQHCAHVVTFASHSYEQYYQAVRRCWRFGQKRQVTVDIVATEGERGVNENLKRKSDAADRMFTELVAHMNDALRLSRGQKYEKRVEVPSWL